MENLKFAFCQFSEFEFFVSVRIRPETTIAEYSTYIFFFPFITIFNNLPFDSVTLSSHLGGRYNYNVMLGFI